MLLPVTITALANTLLKIDSLIHGFSNMGSFITHKLGFGFLRRPNNYIHVVIRFFVYFCLV